MKKNKEVLPSVSISLISDVRQRFIGKYCNERYRYRKTKDGEIIKQGIGLEGVK